MAESQTTATYQADDSATRPRCFHRQATSSQPARGTARQGETSHRRCDLLRNCRWDPRSPPNDLAFSGERPPERSEEGRSSAAMPGYAAPFRSSEVPSTNVL